MTTRTLILGDWSRWIRDPIDVLRVLLLAAALGFLLAGDSSGAVLLAGAGAVAWAVRPLQLPRVYDACFVVVHFSLPFFLGPALYIALARADVVPDLKDVDQRHHYAGVFVVAFALGIAMGAPWDIWEWVSDHTLGSHLQLGLNDTVGDLVADTAGSLCGALLLVCWARYGWGSVRRIPGQNQHEDTEAG